MRITGRIAVLLVASFLIIGVNGCGERHKPPLRISSSPWPGYEPLYLARDLGYLKPEKISLFELPSSDINFESFRNHSTDIATLTLDETMAMLQDDVKLRIVLVLDISHGGDAVMARPDIQSLSDIKGKRISIVNIPLGLYMLKRLLDTANVKREDVEVFPMPDNKQEKFYREGNADVVITYEPFKSNLKTAGAHQIFDSSQIPNEIFDVLVVHEDVYQQRREELCDLVGQWFRALNYIESQPEDAGERITRRLGLDASEFEGLMSGIKLGDTERNQTLLGGKQPGLFAPAEKLMQIMMDENLLVRPVNYQAAVDSTFAHCYQ